MDIQPTTTDNDTTATVMTKMFVALLTGPKASAILARFGITIDPTLLSVCIIGLLHKLHGLIKTHTTWTWL